MSVARVGVVVPWYLPIKLRILGVGNWGRMKHETRSDTKRTENKEKELEKHTNDDQEIKKTRRKWYKEEKKSRETMKRTNKQIRNSRINTISS